MTTSDLSRGPVTQALYKQLIELEIAVAKARKKRKHSSAGGEHAEISNAERLRIFVDSNIIAIHRADIYGKFTEVNEATERLLGYSKEEFYSGAVNWVDITPPEYAELDRIAIQQLKESGSTSFFEKEYIRKDGTRVPVLLHVSAIDKEGNDCMVFVIDQTKQKEIELQLRHSEANFRLLAEAIPQIVWISYSSGRIKYANKRFYDYTGLKSEDDDGLLWLSVLHPLDKEQLLAEAQRAAKAKQPFNMEVRYLGKDGNYRWHLVKGIQMIDAKSGKQLWFGTSTDIDAQKRIADDLKESEAHFSTLANAIPQIVFTADPNGKVDFFNQRWFEYTGLSAEQSESDGWHLLIHRDDLRNYLDGWNKALRTGESYETEFRLGSAVGTRKDDKAYRWHLARAVALRSPDGSILKWFATWTEIEGNQRSV